MTPDQNKYQRESPHGNIYVKVNDHALLIDLLVPHIIISNVQTTSLVPNVGQREKHEKVNKLELECQVYGVSQSLKTDGNNILQSSTDCLHIKKLDMISLLIPHTKQISFMIYCYNSFTDYFLLFKFFF